MEPDRQTDTFLPHITILVHNYLLPREGVKVKNAVTLSYYDKASKQLVNIILNVYCVANVVICVTHSCFDRFPNNKLMTLVIFI